MRLLYLLLLACLPLSILQAQPPAKKTVAPRAVKPLTVLRIDATPVKVRYLDSAKLAQLKKSPQFQYSSEVTGPSLWTRFWRWFWHLFTDKRYNPERSLFFKILQYVLIAIGIGALVFIILKVAGVDISGLIGRKRADASLPYAETLENIHEIDFDTHIDQAITQHNYRLAIRLLYLKSLKQLSDAGLIHWQIDKTNSTYINELDNLQQREAFAILTRQFEFVWYGEFAINQQAFQNIKTLFINFKQTLPAS
jgi:hypothetical protein